MTKTEIIAFNERHAFEKIRATYKVGDTITALKLIHTCYGIGDLKKAGAKLKEICFDLMEEGES